MIVSFHSVSGPETFVVTDHTASSDSSLARVDVTRTTNDTGTEKFTTNHGQGSDGSETTVSGVSMVVRVRIRVNQFQMRTTITAMFWVCLDCWSWSVFRLQGLDLLAPRADTNNTSFDIATHGTSPVRLSDSQLQQLSEVKHTCLSEYR